MYQASVREALDTNGSFNTIFEPEVSSLQRLEVLSETLMVFLRSLSDGIITADVWQNMNSQMVAREKAKQPPLSWEETQAWVLESLAYSPAHSVSFTFVTFMLARIANEVAPATSIPPPPPSHSKKHSEERKRRDSLTHQEYQKHQQPTASIPPPTPASSAAFTAAGSFRRQSRSLTGSTSSTSSDAHSNPNSAKTSTAITTNPIALRRQAVESAFASIFANFLISADVPVPSKDKERRAMEERKKNVIEPFLKIIGGDRRGPSGGGS